MKHILTLTLLLLTFYLGLHGDRLAILEDGKPVIILPYRADIYPEEDRARLKEGIAFETNEDLSALLEDFIS